MWGGAWRGAGRVLWGGASASLGTGRGGAPRRWLTAISQMPRRTVAPRQFALLVVPASTLALGCWQVKRWRWKLGEIAALGLRTVKEPVELPDTLAEVAELEFCPVHARGEFLHDQEMLYGPRSLLTEKQSADAGSLLSQDKTGYCVVTPLRLSESGAIILVNRGWVPKQKKDPRTRMEGQVTGEQTLTGLVRTQEQRGTFMPASKGTSSLFIYRDVKGMSELARCAPVYIEAREGVPGGPKGGQTRVTLRNDHVSYMITWFSLSFITSYMWWRRYVKIPV